MTDPENSTTTRKSISRFFRSTYQLGRMAYDAAPMLFVATIVVRILQSLLPAATAYVLKLVFDRLGLVFAGEAVFVFEQDVLPFLLLFGLLTTLSNSLIALNTYVNEEMGRQLSLYTMSLIHTQLLKFEGLYYFESPLFHNTLSETTANANNLPAHLLRDLTAIFGALLTLISFFGIILAFSPILTIIMVVSVIPAFMAQFRFRRLRFDVVWKSTTEKRKSGYYSSLLFNTQFAREIRLFDIGHYIQDKFIKSREDIFLSFRKLGQKELAVNTGLNALSAIITVGTYIFVIAQAFARLITLGDVTFYIEAARNVQGLLGALSFNLVRISEQTLFFTHFQNLMALPPTLEQYEPVQDVPVLQHQIELRGVSFRYDENSDYVLKDVNLTIRKNESLALVGLNGAGKTTIVKLLARFYDPTEGEILWDGIDIRHFEPKALRRRMGTVLQDFTKYAWNANDNIGIGDVRYINDQDRIRQAARDMGVDQFITNLPDGYNTILDRSLVAEDEHGTDLSGGQWQKIAIARSYLREADLLMLDEPTSALDAEAEHDIYERFAEISQDRATLLISHRFSTVRMADKIAIIEDGRITEYGTHDALVSQNGAYAYLYRLQVTQYT